MARNPIPFHREVLVAAFLIPFPDVLAHIPTDVQVPGYVEDGYLYKLCHPFMTKKWATPFGTAHFNSIGYW